VIALFFEVRPKAGQEATYLEMAAKLKPALDHNGGLVWLDRSRSAQRPAWFLSHQFWADEASMVRWRGNPAHHRAQACGRTDILTDYRLRVGQVIASVASGDEHVASWPVPPHAAYNDPALTAERHVVSLVFSAELDGLPASGETFQSVYDDELRVAVVPVDGERAGHAVLRSLVGKPGLRQARLCLVSRDYGMFDRREAPQYFDAATTA
jgi:heme-degrading monooxygenase HmoA